MRKKRCSFGTGHAWRTQRSAPKYQEALHAHTKHAHTRSGLLRPPKAATLAAQWSQVPRSTKCTHAKRTHAFRFTPPPQCSNISSSVVASTKKHKTHTRTQNANKRSGLLRPPNAATLYSSSVVARTNKHKTHTRTQNAHKRSGLLRPPNDAATLAAQWPRREIGTQHLVAVGNLANILSQPNKKTPTLLRHGRCLLCIPPSLKRSPNATLPAFAIRVVSVASLATA